MVACSLALVESQVGTSSRIHRPHACTSFRAVVQGQGTGVWMPCCCGSKLPVCHHVKISGPRVKVLHRGLQLIARSQQIFQLAPAMYAPRHNKCHLWKHFWIPRPCNSCSSSTCAPQVGLKRLKLQEITHFPHSSRFQQAVQLWSSLDLFLIFWHVLYLEVAETLCINGTPGVGIFSSTDRGGSRGFFCWNTFFDRTHHEPWISELVIIGSDRPSNNLYTKARTASFSSGSDDERCMWLF